MYIKVYGESTKTGEIKLIFSCLAYTKQAIKTATENAKIHGYKIHQALLIAGWEYAPIDITNNFNKTV